MRASFVTCLLLLSATPAAAQAPAAGLRADVQGLPATPEHAGLPRYELALTLADDLASFTLEETIHLTNQGRTPMRSVVLRVFANATAPQPRVTLADRRCAGCRIETPSPSAIVVTLDAPLAPGATRALSLRLRGDLRALAASETSMEGASLGSLGSLLSGPHASGQGDDYGLLAVSEGVASMSGFFAVLARRRAGRWEQSDASTLGDLTTDSLGHYRVQLRTPRGVKVVATGVEGAPRRRGPHEVRVIEGALLRDFALVASRRLRHLERDVGGVRVRSWFVDGDDAAGAEVLEAAARSMQLFTRRFGAYPYTELDVVEAPVVGGAGGVEFSAMVTIAQMFYRPMGQGGALGGLLGGGAGGVDLEARRHAMLEFVTAHEVAHQWWHGIVGSDSRRHPVQDEALAQYSAVLYVTDRYGAARGRAEAEQQVAAGYHMMRLMGRPDGAADRPVSAFGDSMSYGGIVYGKAPFLYRELRQLLGDRRFFAALQSYASTYRFAEAPPRALFDRMARGRRRARVRALERRWLDEAHGDEDLGQPDLGRMLGLGSSANDPQTQALLRTLGGMLGQSGMGQPGSGQPGSTAGGSGGEGALLQGLMRMLGGSGQDAEAEEAMRELRRMLER